MRERGKQVCFTINANLLAEIDAIAGTLKRSRSDTIGLLLATALRTNAKNYVIDSGGTGFVFVDKKDEQEDKKEGI